MKLRDLSKAFGELAHYQVEDVAFFWNMVARFIEDMDLVVYSLMREQGRSEIGSGLMREAIRLVAGEAAAKAKRPENLFVSPAMVRDFARSPAPHHEEAVDVLAAFLTNEVSRVLVGAAQLAKEEKAETIKLRHILPGCESWPWPLNRYC